LHSCTYDTNEDCDQKYTSHVPAPFSLQTIELLEIQYSKEDPSTAFVSSNVSFLTNRPCNSKVQTFNQLVIVAETVQTFEVNLASFFCDTAMQPWNRYAAFVEDTFNLRISLSHRLSLYLVRYQGDGKAQASWKTMTSQAILCKVIDCDFADSLNDHKAVIKLEVTISHHMTNINHWHTEDCWVARVGRYHLRLKSHKHLMVHKSAFAPTAMRPRSSRLSPLAGFSVALAIASHNVGAFNGTRLLSASNQARARP